MLELFIEMTNQVFWEGYAHQLSAENPALFHFRFNQFVDAYEQRRTVEKNNKGYFAKIIELNYKHSLS